VQKANRVIACEWSQRNTPRHNTAASSTSYNKVPLQTRHSHFGQQWRNNDADV